MDDYFTEERIVTLITHHGWELEHDGQSYYLRQRDAHHMQTERFSLPPSKPDATDPALTDTDGG